MDCSPPGSSVHGDSSGKDTRVGCHALFQVIFSTQGLNPGVLHCRQILYRLSHRESPRIMNWVSYPFSRGSFRPRNQTGVSCIAGGYILHCTYKKKQNCRYDQSFTTKYFSMYFLKMRTFSCINTA